jgi:DegV family protein with EDD domain
MAEEGKTKEEIEAHVCELRPLVRASFVVDTLTFLHRGGRCSSVAAFAGSALRLHPRIGVADGKMAAGKKYMGNMQKVIMTYTKEMEADLLAAKPDRVFITHSGCSEEIIASVREYLESLGHFSEILVTRAGGVISSHCGPNTLGVLFIAGE